MSDIVTTMSSLDHIERHFLAACQKYMENPYESLLGSRVRPGTADAVKEVPPDLL